MKTLILGGVRSGKSRLAQRLAQDGGRPVTYIATARDGDDAELQERIRRHRQSRPPQWRVVEEPLALGDVLRHEASPDSCLLVECLTLWLTNLLLTADDELLQQERQRLLTILPALPGHVIVVSNEIGLGVVPMSPLSRRFVDEAGMLHQQLAQVCERVVLVAAGLPLVLKGAL
jgi:adenosylcobinamide kinase/adenosylcobinamide-phosphate guanylyltransferase